MRLQLLSYFVESIWRVGDISVLDFYSLEQSSVHIRSTLKLLSRNHAIHMQQEVRFMEVQASNE